MDFNVAQPFEKGVFHPFRRIEHATAADRQQGVRSHLTRIAHRFIDAFTFRILANIQKDACKLWSHSMCRQVKEARYFFDNPSLLKPTVRKQQHPFRPQPAEQIRHERAGARSGVNGGAQPKVR